MLGRKSCLNNTPQIHTQSNTDKKYALPDNSTITEIIFKSDLAVGDFLIVFWPPDNTAKQIYKISANKSYKINLNIPNGGIVNVQCSFDGELTIFYIIN